MKQQGVKLILPIHILNILKWLKVLVFSRKSEITVPIEVLIHRIKQKSNYCMFKKLICALELNYGSIYCILATRIIQSFRVEFQREYWTLYHISFLSFPGKNSKLIAYLYILSLCVSLSLSLNKQKSRTVSSICLDWC